jgi:hypothetical protein
MSINRFLTYFVYILHVLTIILMLISFYCLFTQFFDLFFYQDVSNSIVYNVSDSNYMYTKDDNNIGEHNRNDTSSLCSCSSCTCSNPSIHVPSTIFTLVDKYKNVGKRHIYWFIFEKGKSNFSSYNTFKSTWNPNTKILNELKKRFKGDQEKMLLNKRTLAWFFKRSKPGGGRGL